MIRKRRLLVVGAGLLALAAVGLAAANYADPPRRAGTLSWLFGRGSTEEPNAIRVSGNIEATEADVSFKIAGRLDQRLVDEGQIVSPGAVVARLDTSDLICDVQARQADLELAKAALAELDAGSRPDEIAAAVAAKEKAKAALDDLVAGSRDQEKKAALAARNAAEVEMGRRLTEFRRIARLRENKAVAAEDYDVAKSAYEVSVERHREAEQQWSLVMAGSREKQIEQAERAWRQAAAQCRLVEDGPRKEVKDQARARVKQAEASLALAKTRLGYAELTWPPAGVVPPPSAALPKYVVLSKNLEPGEYVAPGTPVVTIGDLVNVWLRAYVNEGDLGRVKVNQQARVTTDTYPGKVYEGRVSFISSEAEFTPKNVQTEKERVKLVYRIKIDIRNPAMELKPGMPADAEIEVGSGQ